MKKTVAICETQPVTTEGVRALLASSNELEFSDALASLAAAVDAVRHDPPSILILDKAFGGQAILDTLTEVKASGRATGTVVWGVSITEAEALRFIQAGARGILRKCTDLDSLMICLHSVAAGATWMEQSVFHETPRTRRASRRGLTPRERQVFELVGLGMKNREVAAELGIRPGTVKVHLKHIFEKTGAQGRYGLALTGLSSAAASG